MITPVFKGEGYSKSPTIFSNGSCVDDGKFDLGLTSFGNIIEL